MRRRIRRGFIIGIVGYVVVASVILATLIGLHSGIKTAQTELASATARLAHAQEDLEKTKAILQDVQRQYAAVSAQKTAADHALMQEHRNIEELNKQISQLQCALAASRSAIEAFHRRDYGAAVSLYEQALACDPDNAYLLNLQAYSLFKEGKLPEAVSTERRSVRADPGYAWGQFDLARFLCASGSTRLTEAKVAIDEALRLRPDLLEVMRADGEFRRLCRGLVP